MACNGCIVALSGTPIGSTEPESPPTSKVSPGLIVGGVAAAVVILLMLLAPQK
jgi:hypothetical protein